MRLWAHRYQLMPRQRLSPIASAGARKGALLRMRTDSGAEGFADLHPWPELGDLSLETQLAMLARGETTAQSRASLQLANVDAEARARGVSLFDGLTIPESHWPGNDPPDGFDTVKIKEVMPVPDHVRVRIDFNGSLTAKEFQEIAETLPRERIDFVEDPCPYDPRTWSSLRETTGLRLALDLAAGDRIVTPGTFDVLVHKPALRTDWPSAEGEIVVTSYMDHPIGQFGAAHTAASHKAAARCGLMTHVLYETDAFIERIECAGARLLPPKGTGLGFDDLLEKLTWTTLR
jgi:O-succinylbenzoate synthase